ncbi:MAG: 4-hydroxy-tetrahydrodipicolinate synthase [Alphaproteobacteria bacterium]|nr:4-hydroxy-tetrahydrodipicolinate synthase [Alphaproteobacteria bacterium]
MFSGSITALITPFRNGEVDEKAFQEFVDWQIQEGSNGVVPVGTTGESPTLSHDEHKRVVELCVEVAKGKVPVIAGAGSNSTAEAIDLTRHARSAGADAALIVTPYYNKPTQEGMYQHFSSIAAATSLPCVMYNVPGRTSSNIASDTVIRLSKVDNIVGVKEASANFHQISEIIGGVGEEFLVYSGNDGDTLLLMALGGYGVIGVITHLVGAQTKDMMNLFMAGKTGEAAVIHRHLLGLVDAMFCVANPIPLKYAMNQLGFRVGGTRLPLCGPDGNVASAIVETLKNYKIDLPIV